MSMPPPYGMDPAEAHSALRRGVVSAVAGIALIAALGFLIARSDVGSAAVADLAARMRPGRLALAWTLMTSAFVFMAFRWRVLMPAEARPPIW